MEPMAKDSPSTPRLTAKLLMLIERDARSKSEIATKTGIAVQALNHYLAGTSPRPDVALALARTLNVDPVWLVDEDAPAESKPVRALEYAAKSLHPIGMTAVFNHHYEARATVVKKAIDEAERVDWPTVVEQIVEVGAVDRLPVEVRDAILHINRLKSVLMGLQVYTMTTAARQRSLACDGDPNPDSLEFTDLMARLFRVTEQLEAREEVRRILFVDPTEGDMPAIMRLISGTGYHEALTDVKMNANKNGVKVWSGASTNIDAASAAYETFKAFANQQNKS